MLELSGKSVGVLQLRAAGVSVQLAAAYVALFLELCISLCELFCCCFLQINLLLEFLDLTASSTRSSTCFQVT